MPTVDFFRGKRVIDYTPDADLTNKVVYRIRYDYEHENDFNELLDNFLEQEGLDQIKSLIFGLWDEDVMDYMPDEIVQKIAANANKLPNLTGLVWADISYDESEISWIGNTDVAPLIHAFPKLEYFKVRGGNNLGFGNLKHDTLKTLKVETGGLDNSTLQEIINADLPNLETLNIWLGSSNYGFDSTVDDLKPLLIGKAYPEMRYPFPKLKTLGLCNCEIADDLAEALKDAETMLTQVNELDMSMGIMTDRGVEALIDNEHIGKLKKLKLDNNFIKDTDLVEQLRAKGLKVSASGQKEPYDEDYYYVDVSE